VRIYVAGSGQSKVERGVRMAFNRDHRYQRSLFDSQDVGCRVKSPLFLNEVLVHEASQTVGIARVTYYPIDGMLKNILIGLELRDKARRDFPLVELRRASPEEESTLQYDPDADADEEPAAAAKSL
jgi:hypothetical protein